MILTHDYLRSQRRHTFDSAFESVSNQILNENTRMYTKSQSFDIFLSHSSLDHSEVLVLIDLFNKCGYSVYVDWIFDKQLDRSNVTPQTAETLRERMEQSRGLSYLATSNASRSKWCPWELGYFDAKSNSRCCILPVLQETTTTFRGQEYLGLYPYLEYEKIENSDKYNFWVQAQDSTKYVSLGQWLHGKNPYEH